MRRSRWRKRKRNITRRKKKRLRRSRITRRWRKNWRRKNRRRRIKMKRNMEMMYVDHCKVFCKYSLISPIYRFHPPRPHILPIDIAPQGLGVP